MSSLSPMPRPVAHDLALALIECSTAPVLLLDGDLRVLAMSNTFGTTFLVNPQEAVGQEFARLSGGEWGSPQVTALLKATVAGLAEVDEYEMELKRSGRETRCLIINARKLAYGDSKDLRLMLTITDVTDARMAEKLKDDMVRERSLLLEELRHRVANSLQIIAGVLMQNALKVQSEEARGHLYEAHNRVMSIAAIQHHLTPSRDGDVALAAYFKALCESIGASLIRDRSQTTLTATSDDTVTSADVSVSLGLILTELVINALKHAFPDNRKGSINVDYRSDGAAWTLSVNDDGIGMTQGATKAAAGLGTSIVRAIASQLGAEVRATPLHPGTSVAVTGDTSRPVVTSAL